MLHRIFMILWSTVNKICQIAFIDLVCLFLLCELINSDECLLIYLFDKINQYINKKIELIGPWDLAVIF